MLLKEYAWWHRLTPEVVIQGFGKRGGIVQADEPECPAVTQQFIEEVSSVGALLFQPWRHSGPM